MRLKVLFSEAVTVSSADKTGDRLTVSTREDVAESVNEGETDSLKVIDGLGLWERV